MIHIRSRLVRVAAVGLLSVGLVGFSAGGVAAATGWQSVISGAAVVPGPGDPDGSALVRITYIDPTYGDVCWIVTTHGLDPVSSIQVRAGAAGATGAVLLDLTLTTDADGRFADCLGSQDEAALQAIVDDPAGTYVQVATSAFPDGAVRGQLAQLDVVESVYVTVMVCPAGITTLAQARAAVAPGPSTDGEWNVCAPTGPAGRIPPAPGGLAWLLTPVEFDAGLLVASGSGPALGTDAASFNFGNGTCSPPDGWCTSTGTFRFEGIPAGNVTVTQGLFPPGYQVGWTEIFVSGNASTGSGAVVPLALSGGDSDVYVTYFDVLPGSGGPSGPPCHRPPNHGHQPKPCSENPGKGHHRGGPHH